MGKMTRKNAPCAFWAAFQNASPPLNMTLTKFDIRST